MTFKGVNKIIFCRILCLCICFIFAPAAYWWQAMNYQWVSGSDEFFITALFDMWFYNYKVDLRVQLYFKISSQALDLKEFMPEEELYSISDI